MLPKIRKSRKGHAKCQNRRWKLWYVSAVLAVLFSAGFGLLGAYPMGLGDFGFEGFEAFPKAWRPKPLESMAFRALPPEP